MVVSPDPIGWFVMITEMRFSPLFLIQKLIHCAKAIAIFYCQTCVSIKKHYLTLTWLQKDVAIISIVKSQHWRFQGGRQGLSRGSKLFHFYAVFGKTNYKKHKLRGWRPYLRKILDSPHEENANPWGNENIFSERFCRKHQNERNWT